MKFASSLALALGLLVAGLGASADAPGPNSPPTDSSGTTPPAKIVKANYSLAVSAGLTSLSYAENGYATLNELAVTPKISYRVLLPLPHFDFGLSGYATALALSSSQPGVTARFIGVNARVGYGGFEILPYPWKFSVMAGMYYTTMSVEGAPFGFGGLLGPQIYPSIRYGLGKANTLSAAFKFSPIGTFFSTSDRELAVNLAWTRSLGDLSSFILSVDLSDLRFANEGSNAVSRSGTLSAGYGW